MEDYDAFIGPLLNLLVLGSVLVGVVNWLNNRLNLLSQKINDLNNRLSLADASIEGKLTNFELRINGNFELINHRTNRFTDEMKRARSQVDRDLERLEGQINQISGYLDKHHNFKPRS